MVLIMGNVNTKRLVISNYTLIYRNIDVQKDSLKLTKPFFFSLNSINTIGYSYILRQ